MQGGILLHQLFHRIDFVQPPRPEVFVVPGVFANRNREAYAVEFHHPLAARRGKVALLVKDVVKGQQPFVLLQKQPPPIQQDCRIHGRLSAAAGGRQRNSNDDCGGQTARHRSQLIDGRSAADKKAWFLKKIRRRIAADGEFGKDREPCSCFSCAATCGNNFFEVSGEISNRRIDLGQCDLHTSSLQRQANGPGPDQRPTFPFASC